MEIKYYLEDDVRKPFENYRQTMTLILLAEGT